LDHVVARLREAREQPQVTQHGCGQAVPLPSRDLLLQIVAALRSVLFPAHFGPAELSRAVVDHFVGYTLDRTLQSLREQIRRGLLLSCDGIADAPTQAEHMTQQFASLLPEIYLQLQSDVRAAFAGDPAATSPDEAMLCYPGVTAITHHRLAHALHRLAVPLIPRIIAELSHTQTGIDIHPGAQIGSSFFIDHGTGVVIGETCVIGERVRIYQGVTLGAKSFPLDEHGNPRKGIPRHPVLEDDVVIYAGATILGRIVIGRGSSIGGNVWLTRSVPPNSRLTQAQASESFTDGSGI